MRRQALMLVCSLYLVPALALAFDHTHAIWNGLLQRHVLMSAEGSSSRVDYQGMAGERPLLQQYLQGLSGVSADEFRRFSSSEQLAWLINAYNAWTVELVLTRYPDLHSIRELGGVFISAWQQRFFQLFGEAQHLDHIEHELIRAPGRYDEPRIHFALNCASIGCPLLAPEAYVAEGLAAQLETGMRRFLSDRSRNRYDPASDTLQVSRIFDWYGEDFTRSPEVAATIAVALGRHAELFSSDPALQARLRAGSVRVEFLEYDWRLNDTRTLP
jgi:hypothetical protein